MRSRLAHSGAHHKTGAKPLSTTPDPKTCPGRRSGPTHPALLSQRSGDDQAWVLPPFCDGLSHLRPQRLGPAHVLVTTQCSLNNLSRWVICQHGYRAACPRPLRVVIFTNDHRPAHVHVFGDGEAKINLLGVDGTPELIWAHAMSRGEVRCALRVDNRAAEVPARPLGGNSWPICLTPRSILRWPAVRPPASLNRGRRRRATIPHTRSHHRRTDQWMHVHFPAAAGAGTG